MGDMNAHTGMIGEGTGMGTCWCSLKVKVNQENLNESMAEGHVTLCADQEFAVDYMRVNGRMCECVLHIDR